MRTDGLMDGNPELKCFPFSSRDSFIILLDRRKKACSLAKQFMRQNHTSKQRAPAANFLLHFGFWVGPMPMHSVILHLLDHRLQVLGHLFLKAGHGITFTSLGTDPGSQFHSCYSSCSFRSGEGILATLECLRTLSHIHHHLLLEAKRSCGMGTNHFLLCKCNSY